MSHVDGISALALRDGNRDRRMRAILARAERDVRRRFRVAVANLRDVSYEDRAAAVGGDNDLSYVLERSQARARLDVHFTSGRHGPLCGPADIGLRDRTLNHQRIEVVGRQARGVNLYAHLASPSADQRHRGNVGHFGDRVAQVSGDEAQLVVRVTWRPQRDGENRHVIDGARFDDWADDTRRNPVCVRGELLIQADERPVLRFAHLEPDDHHRLTGAGSGIEILDAGNLPQQLLHRPRHALFDIGRRRARHLDEDVHHGDDDLRLFFARQSDHCERAQGDRGDDEQRCQLGLDERGGQPAGSSVDVSHRVPALTRRPSARPGGGPTMTVSPSASPARISLPFTLTSRSRAIPLSSTKTEVICPWRTSARSGRRSARRLPSVKRARPNVPDRAPEESGREIFTRNARASASTARATSDTVPLTVLVIPSGPSSETGTASPRAMAAMREPSTRTSSRKARVSSSRSSGVPGAAMLPASTIFSVTTPANGAVIVVKAAVAPAASLAPRALSTCDEAARACAAAAAARPSAPRSAAVASSSSCAVAERRACSPVMRS